MAALGLSSCGQDAAHWKMSDPNEGATVASDVANPRYYTPDSAGTERRALEGWEQRGRTGKNGTRLSGELSVGVGAHF